MGQSESDKLAKSGVDSDETLAHARSDSPADSSWPVVPADLAGDVAAQEDWVIEAMAQGRWPDGDQAFMQHAGRQWGITVYAIRKRAEFAGKYLRRLGMKDEIVQLCRVRYERMGRREDAVGLNATIALERSVGAGRDQDSSAKDPELRRKMVNAIANPNNLWAEILEEALVKARDKHGQGLRDIVERVFGMVTQGEVM